MRVTTNIPAQGDFEKVFIGDYRISVFGLATKAC